MNNLSHIYFAGIEPPAPRLRRGQRGFSTESTFLGAQPPPKFIPKPDTEAVDPFVVWLFKQAGLDARNYRPGMLRRRLPACLRLLGVSRVEAAKKTLESQPELVSQAISPLLIGVSEFFRDRPVFHHLQTAILPERLKTAGGLRVLSAGCSEGQELYSIAILLDQLGGLERSYLLGVDCRPEAIARAQAGWFPTAALTGMDPLWREHYFQVEGSQARISPGLREKTEWAVDNLLSPGTSHPRRGWDLILCRNLAIYLENSQASQLWQRLSAQLAPGGWLVTGKAEQPPSSLSLARISPCFYRKIDA